MLILFLEDDGDVDNGSVSNIKHLYGIYGIYYQQIVSSRWRLRPAYSATVTDAPERVTDVIGGLIEDLTDCTGLIFY